MGTNANRLYYRGSETRIEQGHALKRIMERRELGARVPRVNGGSLRWFADGVTREEARARVVVNFTSDLRMGDTEHNTANFIQARFDKAIANAPTNDWIKASLTTRKAPEPA